MTTQTSREVIGIIGQVIHPLKAQYLFEKYCAEKDLSMNDFCVDDVPQFILYFAEKRDSLSSVNDNKFYKILRDLVLLSNSEEGNDNVSKGAEVQ